MYNSLEGHPSICPLLSHTISEDSVEITLPLGKSCPFPPPDRFDEYMKVVLEGVFTLWNNNIIYGDIKPENVIELNGQYRMIDLDLCHFRRVISFRVCQTYGDEQHFKYDQEGIPYDTSLELIWSLGFLVNSISTQQTQSHYTKAEYYGFVLNPHVSSLVPDRWKEFVSQTFLPFNKRPQTLEELYLLSPINICKHDFVTKKIPIVKCDSVNFELWNDLQEEMIVHPETVKLAKTFASAYFHHLSEQENYENLFLWYASVFTFEEFTLDLLKYHSNYEVKLEISKFLSIVGTLIPEVCT